MRTIRKTLRAGVTIALLCAGPTGHARGEGADSLSIGSRSERTTQIRGNRDCTECSPEQAREAYPYATLYRLTYRQGRLVMPVNWVSKAARWGRPVWPPQVYVRGPASP